MSRLYFHYMVMGFSNSYIIGGENGGDAILVDPGIMDTDLIMLVENNGYTIRHVLVTHGHKAHTAGLNTLQKIYPSKVYSTSPRINDITVERVSDQDLLDLSGIKVQVFEIPGHSSDSLVFRIDQMLFTGDVLGAGFIGSTPNSYARSVLLSGIKEKLLCFDDDQIFPGHGPPSTIKVEKAFNPSLFEEQ